MPVFAVFLRVSVTKLDTARHSQDFLKDTSATSNSNQKYTKAEGNICFLIFVNDTSDQLKNGKVCDILNI